MLSLITAALVAAQAAPAPQQGQMPRGDMAGMQHEQHQGMKKDCCKDCCKDMGEHDGHAPDAQRQKKSGQ